MGLRGRQPPPDRPRGCSRCTTTKTAWKRPWPPRGAARRRSGWRSTWRAWSGGRRWRPSRQRSRRWSRASGAPSGSQLRGGRRRPRRRWPGRTFESPERACRRGRRWSASRPDPAASSTARYRRASRWSGKRSRVPPVPGRAGGRRRRSCRSGNRPAPLAPSGQTRARRAQVTSPAPRTVSAATLGSGAPRPPTSVALALQLLASLGRQELARPQERRADRRRGSAGVPRVESRRRLCPLAPRDHRRERRAPRSASRGQRTGSLRGPGAARGGRRNSLLGGPFRGPPISCPCGGPKPDRVDGSDVESGDRVHEGLGRVQALLCADLRRALERPRGAPI